MHPEARDMLAQIRRLGSDEAKAVFADHWIRNVADRLDDTWPALYELLRIVRDKELYRDPNWNEAKVSYASFAAYFTDVVGQPFATWMQLEAAHHFVTESAPDLINETLTSVVVAMAERATPMPVQEIGKGKAGPGRGNKTDDNVSRLSYGNSAGYLASVIARDHKGIHDRMKAGEFKSVRQAALAAGIVRPRASVYVDDRDAVSAFLAKHFDAAEIKTICDLAIHKRERREP